MNFSFFLFGCVQGPVGGFRVSLISILSSYLSFTTLAPPISIGARASMGPVLVNFSDSRLETSLIFCENSRKLSYLGGCLVL